MAGRVQRDLIGPILAVNLTVYLILLGLAAWSLDKYINGEQDHPHLGGNPATIFMLVFALVAGVVGVSCVLMGLLHYRTWRNYSLASASSTAIISWAFTVLAFGLVCKQIVLGGRRGKRLSMYVLLLHTGTLNRRYGPGFRSQDIDCGITVPDQARKAATQPSDLQQM